MVFPTEEVQMKINLLVAVALALAALALAACGDSVGVSAGVVPGPYGRAAIGASLQVRGHSAYPPPVYGSGPPVPVSCTRRDANGNPLWVEPYHGQC
jgi:hypothetical protein